MRFGYRIGDGPFDRTVSNGDVTYGMRQCVQGKPSWDSRSDDSSDDSSDDTGDSEVSQYSWWNDLH